MNFPIFPPQASEVARHTDYLYWTLILISVITMIVVFAPMIYFLFKYRRGRKADRRPVHLPELPIEITWTIIPMIVFTGLFAWGANVYWTIERPPPDAMEIDVVGKQWMWKIEHPEGNREINELHVPLGRNVKLTLASQDVIHSFFLPAFRIKQDVVPGRYSTLWFKADKAGRYHLFCSEYCGTHHSAMGGSIIVMPPDAYQKWLEHGAPGSSMAQEGERLFRSYGCSGCHVNSTIVHAPRLEGLYGRSVPLQNGQFVTADEAYLRDSILLPAKDIAAGYTNDMPSFQGHLGEEDVLKLIAYIKSLSDTAPEKGGDGFEMNTTPLTEATVAASEERVPKNYFTEGGHTLKSWLLTTDHKRIGVLYLISLVFYFTVAAIAAAMMRIELITPAGDMVTSETYNKLFTIHGTLMVWFFLIPSIPAVLGNFILPMMLGARDVAFPRLNLLSWYLFNTGGLLALYAVTFGGVDTGWTFYTPYSSTYSNSHVITMAAGIFIAGFGTILTGLNFIVTTHKLRAPGLTWFRLPLFVWSMYSTSAIMILATPVLAMTLALMSLERLWGVGVFDPKLGGDPILFQHLFWFYSHPAVYIMILPGMGVMSELITCFSRKPIFGYHFMAYASVAIAVLGFLVWGHHMFTSGQSIYAGLVFSYLSYMVAVPSAIKVFNWTLTLYRGSISLATPMLYALGFIGLFTIGGLTGLFLAAVGLDVHVQDTYFVVAHFHYIMVGGMVTAFMGGLHYWWPKITGRMYPEKLGQLAALTMFLGFNLTFFPQFVLGYLGMPRRYHAYAPEFQIYNVMSSAGASILAVGYLLPLIYFLWSLKYGERAPANPWKATGLEWQTTSPPPKHNFAETPVVNGPPYQYSAEDTEVEFAANSKKENPHG